jgi:hypothetical protein
MATNTEIQAEIDRREGLVHSPWFLIEEILDLKAQVERLKESEKLKDILCNGCKKKLPPLEPSEIKCPDGYLCRVCSGLDKKKGSEE